MEILNRKNPPVIQPITSINIPSLESGFLSNRMPYRILAGGSQELVYIHLNFNAGAVCSNQKLIASVTNSMLTCGTSKHSAQQIADTFDFYGAEINTDCAPDYAVIGLLCLNKYIDKLLPLFCEIMGESIFPDSELKTILANQKHKWAEDHEDTKILAAEELKRLTFSNHIYSRFADLEDYDRINAETIRSFHAKHYNAGNCSLLIAGNVTSEVMRAIDKTIGQMPVGEKITITLPEIGETASIEPKIIVKDTAVQSSLRMGCSTINMLHPDYAKLKILLTILGGYFGSRLMTNIREEKGYTYGIYSHIRMQKQAGLLRIAGEIKAGYAMQVVEEVKKEMQKLKNEPVGNDELNLVRNYMIGEMQQQFDGPFISFEAISKALTYGADISIFADLQNTIRTVTAAELQETANKYFDFSRIATVIAGKE